MDDEVSQLRNGITAILVAIAKLDEQVKSLSNMSATVQESAVKIAHLEHDVRTAMGKIDDLRIKIDAVELGIEADKRSNKDDRKWLLGTLLGCVAIVMTILNYFSREVG